MKNLRDTNKTPTKPSQPLVLLQIVVNEVVVAGIVPNSSSSENISPSSCCCCSGQQTSRVITFNPLRHRLQFTLPRSPSSQRCIRICVRESGKLCLVHRFQDLLHDRRQSHAFLGERLIKVLCVQWMSLESGRIHIYFHIFNKKSTNNSPQPV